MLSTRVIANMGVTLVNRSFTASAFTTYHYHDQRMRAMLLLTLVLLAAMLVVPLLRDFFHLASPSPAQAGMASAIELA